MTTPGRHGAAVRLGRVGLAVGVCALALAGCTLGEPGTTDDTTVAPPPVPTSGEAAEGVVHDDLSENFRLVVYPSLVQRTEAGVYLTFRASVENTTRTTFRDLSTTLVLDPEMDQYLGAGLHDTVTGEFDVYPPDAPEVREGIAGWGVDMTDHRVLSSEEFFEEAGLDPARITTLARTITLWLRWQGGEEQLTYETPVLDPDGLLGP